MRNKQVCRMALVGMLLTLPGCQLTFLNFVMPATSPVGQVFAVSVQFSNNAQLGSAGCVLQLPLGFTVAGISGNAQPATRDDPTLLSLYTAEPGAYLASWSRNGAQLPGTHIFTAFVQAPVTPTVASIKVALASSTGLPGIWQAASPAAVTAFATITAATHARVINIVAVPAEPFAVDAIGVQLASTSYSSAVAIADLDGDGNDDLINNTSAWLRTGTTWTESNAGLFGSSSLPAPRVAAGDFDGDGWQDIVNAGGYVFWGNGGSQWTSSPGLFNGWSVAAGDINADGRDDIAYGDTQGNLRALLGSSSRTFTNASNGLPSPGGNNGSPELQLADVTGDGWLDIVAKEGVWAGDGQGNWTPGSGLVGMLGGGVAVGDLDADGQPELIYANYWTGVAVMGRVGANAWTAASVTGIPARPASSVAVLDFDRDGWLDLAIAWSDQDYGVQLLRNLGGLSFAVVANSGLPELTSTAALDLAVGDINGDSWPDLAAAIQLERLVVWQNWLGGVSNFGSPCAASLPAAPTITATSAPTIGNAAFALRVSGGLPGVVGASWLGVSARTWNGVPVLPLDMAFIGAPGCTFWTGPELLAFGVFDASGHMLRPVPIPPSPALLRLTFFGQGAAVDGANPAGLAVTGGLAFRIQ